MITISADQLIIVLDLLVSIFTLISVFCLISSVKKSQNSGIFNLENLTDTAQSINKIAENLAPVLDKYLIGGNTDEKKDNAK